MEAIDKDVLHDGSPHVITDYLPSFADKLASEVSELSVHNDLPQIEDQLQGFDPAFDCPPDLQR
jgi:hypothetical protein